MVNALHVLIDLRLIVLFIAKVMQTDQGHSPPPRGQEARTPLAFVHLFVF